MTDIQGPNVQFTGDSSQVKKAAAEGDAAIDQFSKSAETKLGKIRSAGEKSFDALMARVDKLAKDIKGSGATGALNELALAVDKSGGISKLTGVQFDNLTVKIQRLAAQGGKLPPQFAQITAGLKQLEAVSKGSAIGSAFGAQATTQAQALTSRLGPLGGVLTALGPAGIAAGVGITAVGSAAAGTVYVAKTLVEALVQATSWASKITDAAAAMGATTEETQRLEHAAIAGGQSFETLQHAIIKMRENLINTPEVFERMGLSIQKLRGMNATDLFRTVGKSVEGIKDKNEQAAIAVALFGKSWSGIAPIINGGLDEMGNAVVVSDELTKKLNGQNTEINLLKEAWDKLFISLGAGVATSGAVEFVAKLTTALNGLSKWMQEHPGLVGKALLAVTEGSVGPIGGAVGAAIRAVNSLGSGGVSGAAGSAAGVAGAVNPQDTHLGLKPEETKALADADAALATAREKGLIPLQQEINAIDRATAAKLREIDASKHSPPVKEEERAKALQLAAAQKEAALGAVQQAAEVAAVGKAFDFAAQKRDAYEAAISAFGADDAEIAMRMGALADNIERVQHGFANMNASQIGSFRKQLTDLASAGDGITPAVFEQLKKSGDELHVQLVKQGEAVESTGGKWMRVGVAAEEAQMKADAGVKEVNDSLDRQIANLEKAAAAFAGLAQDFDALNEVLQSVGVKSDSKASKTISGLGKWASGASEMAKGLASGNPFEVISGGFHELVGQIETIKAIFGGETDQQKIGKDLGKNVSSGLIDAIKKTKDEKKVSRSIAEQLNLAGILKETGSTSVTSNLTYDLFNGVKLGAVKAKDGIEALGNAFSELKTEAEGGSVASEAAMVAMVHRAKQLQLSIPEIDAALKGWAADARANLKDFFGGQNGGKAGSPEQAAANQQIFNAVMGLDAATEGLVGLAMEGKDAFDALTKSLPAGTALFGLAADFAKIEHALDNPLFKGAAQTATAGGKIFADLYKSDAMSQQTTDALATTLDTGMKQAFEGTDATLSPDERRRLAEEANLPLLVQAQHAEAAGGHLSAETLAELEQARKDGLLPMKSIAEQQLAVQKQIRDGQRGDAPSGAPGGTGAPGGPGGPAGTPYHSAPIDPRNNPSHLAAGGIVTRRSLHELAEAGPEAVLPLPDFSALMARADFSIPSAGGGTSAWGRGGGGGGGGVGRGSVDASVRIGTIVVPAGTSKEDAVEIVRIAISRGSGSGQAFRTEIQRIVKDSLLSKGFVK